MAKRVDTLGLTERVLRNGQCSQFGDDNFLWWYEDSAVELHHLGFNSVLVLVHKDVRRLVWKGCLKWFWQARILKDGRQRRVLWMAANRLARLYKKDLEEEN